MIRTCNIKFSKKYGQIILACDGKRSWRKKEFEYYKSHRKGDRDQQTHIDWPTVFSFMENFKKELANDTSIMVLEVDGLEGDDIIATLALAKPEENNVIISRDHDYKQLQAYTKVKIYDPDEERFVQTDDPHKYIQEHIIRGDRGDGIPNIISAPDSFFNKKRQMPLTAARMEEFLSTPVDEWTNKIALANWKRNQLIIDLRNTPRDLREKLFINYQQQKNKPKKSLFEYLVKKKVTKLIDKVNDFH